MGRYKSIGVCCLFPILAVWIVVAGSRYIENSQTSSYQRISYFGHGMVCFTGIPKKEKSIASDRRSDLEFYDMRHSPDALMMRVVGLNTTSVKWCEEAAP